MAENTKQNFRESKFLYQARQIAFFGMYISPTIDMVNGQKCGLCFPTTGTLCAKMCQDLSPYCMPTRTLQCTNMCLFALFILLRHPSHAFSILLAVFSRICTQMFAIVFPKSLDNGIVAFFAAMNAAFSIAIIPIGIVQNDLADGTISLLHTTHIT